MKCLRPKVKRERHRVTFFSGKEKKDSQISMMLRSFTDRFFFNFSPGFFSGCSIALIVAVVFKIESRKLMEKDYGTAYMANIIPLYRLLLIQWLRKSENRTLLSLTLTNISCPAACLDTSFFTCSCTLPIYTSGGSIESTTPSSLVSSRERS